jgi:hypothetical protein
MPGFPTFPSETSPLRERVAPETFFREAHGGFLEAEQRAGEESGHYFRIGPHVLRIRFAGTRMVPFITPALEHLRTAAVHEPSLTVCVWDSDSTGVPMGPPPWSREDFVFRGEIRGFNTDRIRTAYQAGIDALSLLDLEANLAVYWMRGNAPAPYREKPLQTILYWWLARRGGQLLHCAGVGMPEGGLLLAGRGGSGKSVASLACLRAGLTFLGDDYVLVRADPPPFAQSLYNSVKVNADQLPKFPEFSGAVVNPGTMDADKALIFAHRWAPQCCGSGFPIRALCIPRVTGLRDTIFRPAPAEEVVTAFCTSTLFALPGAGREVYQRVTRLVGEAPSFFLDAGTDLEGIPAAVLEFLSGR